jgi:hypothetical protein
MIVESGGRWGLGFGSRIAKREKKTAGKARLPWQNQKVNRGISILYPNYDLKTGQLAKNLAWWVDSARFAPDRFQLVIGTKKLNKAEFKEVHSLLRRQDIIFEVDEMDNDNAIWNQCAERSMFENMLFVEGHVYPNKTFLQKLYETTRVSSGERVINTNTRNTTNSDFERLMDRWFNETIQRRQSSHDFIFLSRWAFLIPKKVFQRYGPLIQDYEQFGPPFLSAVLFKNKVGISTADFTGLTHEMESVIGHHHAATRCYVRGFAKAEKRIHAEGLSELFGSNPDFEKLQSRWRKKQAINSDIKPGAWEVLWYIILPKMEIKLLEFLVMYFPMPQEIKYRLFQCAHRRVAMDEYRNHLFNRSHEK